MTKTVCNAEVIRPRAKAVVFSMPASVIVLAFASMDFFWDGRLTFEEIDGLVSNKVSSQVLCCVYTANNGSTVKVDTLEKLQKTGVAGILLKIDGTTHHGNGLLIGLEERLVYETTHRLRGLLVLALASKPPGGFGCQEDKDGERSREHPLEGDRNSGMKWLAKCQRVPER